MSRAQHSFHASPSSRQDTFPHTHTHRKIFSLFPLGMAGSWFWNISIYAFVWVFLYRKKKRVNLKYSVIYYVLLQFHQFLIGEHNTFFQKILLIQHIFQYIYMRVVHEQYLCINMIWRITVCVLPWSAVFESSPGLLTLTDMPSEWVCSVLLPLSGVLCLRETGRGPLSEPVNLRTVWAPSLKPNSSDTLLDRAWEGW